MPVPSQPHAHVIAGSRQRAALDPFAIRVVVPLWFRLSLLWATTTPSSISVVRGWCGRPWRTGRVGPLGLVPRSSSCGCPFWRERFCGHPTPDRRCFACSADQWLPIAWAATARAPATCLVVAHKAVNAPLRHHNSKIDGGCDRSPAARKRPWPRTWSCATDYSRAY